MAATNTFSFANVSPSQSLVFIVNEQAGRYTIHRDALFQRFPLLQDTLDAVPERCDVYPWWNYDPEPKGSRANITEKMFQVFFQYTYAGTYDAPQPVQSNVRILKKIRREFLRESFISKYATFNEAVHVVPHGCPPSDDGTADFGEVFKWHVDINAFASTFDSGNLRQVAKYKLALTLMAVRPSTESVMDLVQYVYHNVFCADCELLVSHYVACRLDEFLKNEDFVESLRDNSEVMLDVIELLYN
ncbi:hypothetical protein VFPPC_04261 [Pochonia chlamydosporia 170]|uniref:BTB domain-containing protein n=1 Tax=Pochonia chlamydosporia 170 TaxID=1380566 RepID=A0A179FRQ8_METCM|nr:hypothetical protein VFPPC_04261 [Pochonia chlamydosporia 170]OAQ67938.1 hypothetical protein VFPPC_04261 [Pochonia chlamydosporia 170]